MRKTPSDGRLEALLGLSYNEMNKRLRRLQAPAVRRLLELELEGKRRPYVVVRVEQRLARLVRDAAKLDALGTLVKRLRAAEGGR